MESSMHFRRTGAVLRLGILTAVLTWFAQTASEAADAVTLRTSIKDHRFQPTELKAPANTPITLVRPQPRSDPGRVRKQDASGRESRRGQFRDHDQAAPAGAGAVSFLW